MSRVIRKATIKDVDTIVRISNANGPNGQERTVLPEVLSNGYYQAFEIIDNDPHQLLMVTEMDSQVVGTFHLTYLIYLNSECRQDCLVEYVHVHKDWQGKGIGSFMMNWAIRHAKERGCRRIQLTTNKLRKDAHRFYEKLGFQLSHEGAKLNFYE